MWQKLLGKLNNVQFLRERLSCLSEIETDPLVLLTEPGLPLLENFFAISYSAGAIE